MATRASNIQQEVGFNEEEVFKHEKVIKGHNPQSKDNILLVKVSQG
jgi:hypothetical protein